MANLIKISENMSNSIIEKCNFTFVFMIDIRNSTSLNDELSLNELKEIYKLFLNRSYSILKSNGFNNIDIQGDGIYGVYGSEKWNSNLTKCLNELEDHIDFIDNKYGVQSTLSVRYGKEVYAAYGLKDNENKQVAFFGNTVSKCKKSISESFKSSKIIISDSALDKWNDHNSFDRDFYEDFNECFIRGEQRRKLGRLWVKYR